MGEFLRDHLQSPADYFAAQGNPLKGPGKWKTTRCIFHGGSDSLRVNTQSGGWVCMACAVKGGDVLAYHMAAHGLDFIAAAKDLGAWREDGKPSPTYRPKTLPAGQAIAVLNFEASLTAIAACNVSRGVLLSDEDRARLLLASGRIQRIAEEFQ